MVVGTGIRTAGQITSEAADAIRRADHVVYVISDPAGEHLVRSLNPLAESLSSLYSPDLPRVETYERMVCRVLELLRAGKRVCFAAYGHPGVFAFPTHEAVRRARREGFRARMLPGISAEDCLFADLGVDPATSGCQSFEATDFVVNRRVFDPTAHLVLWQIGVLGELRGITPATRPTGMNHLVDRLRDKYPDEHGVYLYEASLESGVDPKIGGLALRHLEHATIAGMATLYVPPHGTPDTDSALAEAFGFETGPR